MLDTTPRKGRMGKPLSLLGQDKVIQRERNTLSGFGKLCKDLVAAQERGIDFNKLVVHKQFGIGLITAFIFASKAGVIVWTVRFKHGLELCLTGELESEYVA